MRMQCRGSNAGSVPLAVTCHAGVNGTPTKGEASTAREIPHATSIKDSVPEIEVVSAEVPRPLVNLVVRLGGAAAERAGHFDVVAHAEPTINRLLHARKVEDMTV